MADEIKRKPGRPPGRKNKPGAGRPRGTYEASDAEIADALELAEGSVDRAAEYLPINKRALYYRINGNPTNDSPANPELQELVRVWREIKIARLEDSVFERAMTSDTLAIFTLKAQAGWKDGRELTIQGPNGGAIPIAVVQESVWEKVNGPSGGSSK
jgi:hypothetical protein